MGKLAHFDIIFANGSGVFYAGNMVQGHVAIQLSESMSLKCIKLAFKGKTKVSWTEREWVGSGDDRKREWISYKSDEKYFDQDVLLCGDKSGSTLDLPSGDHSFPFEFQLPPNLPPSFENRIGHVRYTVKCKIDKKKHDHKMVRAFTVIGILDLNSKPEYMNRMQDEEEKNLCCLCCKNGPITATFNIDRQGYVPGEAISLSAEISNRSSRKMEKSYIDLKMITTFHGKRHGINHGVGHSQRSKKCQTLIARLTHPAIEPHSEDVWSGEQLIIPPLPPSYLVGCKIIDIHYILQLNVDPTGIGFDLEIPFEVTIGTIPLANVIQQNPPMEPMLPVGFQGVFYDLCGGMSPPTPMPESFPPPCYAESVIGRSNIRDGKDDTYVRGNYKEFAPAYTYYNWGHTPQQLPQQQEQQEPQDD